MDECENCEAKLYRYAIRTPAGSAEVDGECLHTWKGNSVAIHRDRKPIAIMFENGSFIVRMRPSHVKVDVC